MKQYVKTNNFTLNEYFSKKIISLKEKKSSLTTNPQAIEARY